MSETTDRKKNLVIGAVGDRSLHRHWLRWNPNFDLFLLYYGDKEGYENESKYYKRSKGYKFHLIQDALNDNPWIYDYEYIWLPDDDIYTTSATVNRLFNMMREYKLDLAQPSIMGWYGSDITLHQKGSLLRYTNWVEIMCPCFSSEALRKCQGTFKENKCGWSIETIWNRLLDHPKDKIAIIDDLIVIHTRAVLTGDTHSSRQDPLTEALKEAREVYDKWGLAGEMSRDLGKGQGYGGEIYCAVTYSQIFKGMEGSVARWQRFWPPLEDLKSIIADIKP